MRTAGLYYAILLWAFLLYGIPVSFKFFVVWAMEKLMPWIQGETPAKPPRGRVEADRRRDVETIAAGLGGLLILSGLIQIVPRLVFVTTADILRLPWAVDLPNWIADWVRWWADVWVRHPIGWNVTSVMVQISLGVLLLSGRHLGPVEQGVSVGLMAISLFLWGVEGLGGIGTSHASLLTGTPGPGLVVFLVTLVMLALRRSRHPTRIWALSRRGWAVWWGAGAVWQVMAAGIFGRPIVGDYTPSGALPQPAWVAAGIRAAQSFAHFHPIVWTLLTVGAFAVIGLAGWREPVSRPIIWAATLLLLAIWWIGQDFGLMAGYGLNINTAPVYLLFVWALWGTGRREVGGDLPGTPPSAPPTGH